MILFNFSVRADELSTRESIDTIITYGVGLSGSVSLLACNSVSKDKPVPNSFYTFNLAAVGYFVMDQLIDDEDEKASREITENGYGGVYDEQMNSYLRSRDVALANAKNAKKKGQYKQAASVVMIASAALAYNEKKVYENSYVKRADLATFQSCSGQSSTPGLIAAKQFQKGRCNNLGGAKVICSDQDKKKLAKLSLDCNKLAVDLGASTDQASCISNSKKITNIMFEIEALDVPEDIVIRPDYKEVESLKLGATTGRYSSINKSNFFITSFLTLGGTQYLPGTRAIVYSGIALIIGANALANNVAKIKFEEDVEYFQGLIDSMESCSASGNCHSGSGDGGSANDEDGDAGGSGGDSEDSSEFGSERFTGTTCYAKNYEDVSASDVVRWGIGSGLTKPPADIASWTEHSTLSMKLHEAGYIDYVLGDWNLWPNKWDETGDLMCSNNDIIRKINTSVWLLSKKADGWHAFMWDWGTTCGPRGMVRKTYGWRRGEMCNCYYGFMLTSNLNYSQSFKTLRSNIVVQKWPSYRCK